LKQGAGEVFIVLQATQEDASCP